MTATAPVDARRALLGGLIDHAAMFPPAELPLDAALEVDRAARATAEGWILNRFLVPASKLEDMPADFEPPLGVVLDTPELPELAGRHVETVEARIARAGAVAGAPARVFLEVLPGDDAALDAVAAAGVGAKVRCGGEALPSAGALAAFILGCHDRGLPFKATAGLHHPVRDGVAHGFLTLLAAAVMARSGERELEEVMLEEDAAAF